MKNTGNTPWNEASLIRLGCVGDSAGDAAKFGPVRITIPAGTSVAPGAQHTFTFTMTPPATPGSYSPKYQMVWEGHQWFGDKASKNIQVTSTPAPAPVASITVTAPNSGETWQRGTSHAVTWKYTGTPGSTVNIVLLKAGTEVGTIIGSTSTGSGGTGSYTWPVYPSGLTGSDFKVSVQSISQPAVKDTSNNYFTITPASTSSPASITVTAPNGWETWQRGTTKTITWNYAGSPGSTVKIVLLKGDVEVGTISAGTSTGSNGKGSYSWPIALSGLTGSDFKVSVQSISQPAIKDSSNSFRITYRGSTGK